MCYTIEWVWETIGGVKLKSRLVGIYFQHATGLWMHHATDKSQRLLSALNQTHVLVKSTERTARNGWSQLVRYPKIIDGASNTVNRSGWYSVQIYSNRSICV